MSSDIDICNLALSHIGDGAQVASIAPTDGSVQSTHCRRFYPMARDQVLEMHPWPFAVKRADLAELEDNPLEDDWAYAYSIPNACLRPLALLVPGSAPIPLSNTGTDAGSFPYIVETGEDGSLILFTNAEGAALRYIARVEDTTRFSPSFTMALSRLLASYLAGPILKGDKGTKVAQQQLQIFEATIGKAMAMSANIGKRDSYRNHLPSFLGGAGALLRDTDIPSE